MSRQQSDAPDEPEETRAVRRIRKDKPWVLWHCWRHQWNRHGRYHTKAEAEIVRTGQTRKYAWVGSWWAPDTYCIQHERDGKPPVKQSVHVKQ